MPDARLALMPVVIRRWWHETLPWAIAWRLPRRVALFVFVRVYATLGTYGEDYEQAYKRWEAGAGR